MSAARFLPYAALLLQLWLPLEAALRGPACARESRTNAAFAASLIGAGLGFIYGILTRDAVFMAAEVFAALAFVGLRRKLNTAPRGG